MLSHPTLDKLHTLRLAGMAKAFEEQLQTPEIGALSFEEHLGLLVDREATDRDNRRLKSRLKHAALRHHGACIEGFDPFMLPFMPVGGVVGPQDAEWGENGSLIDEKRTYPDLGLKSIRLRAVRVFLITCSEVSW